MSRIKLCADNKILVDVSNLNMRTCVCREPSMVDDFYHEKISLPDGSDSVFVSDPVYMLFNQERLNRELGSGAVKIWLDSLTQSNDFLSELRSKCSDNELMYMIKSRHIQSPSELKTWFDYMSENVDKFNAELAALRESADALIVNNEPPKTE